MGLHSPFGYCCYELTMLKTIVNLLDNFCNGCHTDNDYQGGCMGCPVGNLFYECKRYLSDVYINTRTKCKYMKKYNEKLKELSIKIRYLKPHPSFNATWIFEDEPSKDKIEYLRRAVKSLEFYYSQATHPFLNKRELKMKREAPQKCLTTKQEEKS